ncbi:hypothetical protein AM499_18165 [Bacillus sp. FJAT-22090]|nr:hypothetical protein AM499_18165 [Bacillus sp. FJAT-22090]
MLLKVFSWKKCCFSWKLSKFSCKNEALSWNYESFSWNLLLSAKMDETENNIIRPILLRGA